MKLIYIVLGFIFLGVGIVGIILPIMPGTVFLLLALYFFGKGSDRLRDWFMQTQIYHNHLKTYNEQRAMTKKSKISILALATFMLAIGFYFTPVIIGKVIIVLVLLTKYWYFFFKIKTIE